MLRYQKFGVLLENNNEYFHVLEFRVTVIVLPFQEHGQDLREIPITKITGFNRFLWKNNQKKKISMEKKVHFRARATYNSCPDIEICV
jgi:hypothetical protein